MGIMQCNNIDEVGYWFQNLPRGKYDYIQVEIIQRRKDGATVNGFHVVCKPFNYTTLQLPENVELKTKCMTLLYFNGLV